MSVDFSITFYLRTTFTFMQPVNIFMTSCFSNRSVNGSPVDQFDKDEIFITAKKRRAVNNTESNTPFPISIGVGAGNGETIDLSDPNQRKNMDEEQKAQALEQVMAMQEQMKKLMADW